MTWLKFTVILFLACAVGGCSFLDSFQAGLNTEEGVQAAKAIQEAAEEVSTLVKDKDASPESISAAMEKLAVAYRKEEALRGKAKENSNGWLQYLLFYLGAAASYMGTRYGRLGFVKLLLNPKAESETTT